MRATVTLFAYHLLSEFFSLVDPNYAHDSFLGEANSRIVRKSQ